MPVPAEENSRGGAAAWLPGAAAVSIGLAALAAYSDAFRGPWLYDDQGSVVDNPSIRHLATGLRPPTGGWPVSGRPVFNFSLAVNYAISGERTWSYHALSLAIHIAAGLVLFGIVRRTLATLGFSRTRSTVAAWATALLWTVHPLLTESVTYISQRAESLMGLFYLLTLYGFVRFAFRPAGVGGAWRGRAWAGLSVLCCALGMATKEVMVTAPALVLLYDRVFAGRSWPAALRRRAYYGALAATWLVLAGLMADGGSRNGTVGFHSPVAWWAYGLTQFRGVAHYLALSVWPHPLLFSYGLTLGGPPLEIAVDGLIVVTLAVGSLIAAVRGSRLGFLGAWFFLILSPTSTVVPVATELIAEHRVYLSLAAVVGLAVWAGDRALRALACRFAWKPAMAGGLGAGVAAVLALAAGAATHARNHVYGSVLALWSDTVAKSPDDAGARNNLGNVLADRGRLQEALQQFRAALQLVPGYDDPNFNLADTLVKLGRAREAIPHFEVAVRVRPNDARFRYGLGAALLKVGRTDEAERQFEAALAGEAESPVVWYDLGNAFLDGQRLPQAEQAFAKALRLRPDYVDALVNHAGILAQENRVADAIREFREALRLDPRAADIHNNLGGLLAESGRLADARREFEQALAIRPDYREARDNLERVKAMEASGTP